MANLYEIRNAARRAEGKQQLQPSAPFASADGGRNYPAIYRTVYEYHERNSPPRIGLEYWEKAADDLGRTASLSGNDPFVKELLMAAYSEMEREYKRLEAQEGMKNADVL